MSQIREYFDIKDEPLTERKQLEQMHLVYDQLVKDYTQRGQEVVMKDAIISQLTREKIETEKQFNDLLIHTQSKIEQMKEQIIEVPSSLLHSLAFTFQSSDSVFVVVKEDGTVSLKTRAEVNPTTVKQHWKVRRYQWDG